MGMGMGMYNEEEVQLQERQGGFLGPMGEYEKSGRSLFDQWCEPRDKSLKADSMACLICK